MDAVIRALALFFITIGLVGIFVGLVSDTGALEKLVLAVLALMLLFAVVRIRRGLAEPRPRH